MAYIYQIRNDINSKVYVGKTELSIEKRFREHCRDAFKERCEKRPLYAAMRKYGTEHFHVSQLEETDQPEEKECEWIERLRSFKTGYNATMGGDGKRFLDYDLVIETYSKTKNIAEVARILNCSACQVALVLKNAQIPVVSGQDVSKEINSKVINQYDLSGSYIQSFSSINDAAIVLGDKKYHSHISQALNGKRKTAYGYKWSFTSENSVSI